MPVIPEPWPKLNINEVRASGPGEVFPQQLVRLDEIVALLERTNTLLERLLAQQPQHRIPAVKPRRRKAKA